MNRRVAACLWKLFVLLASFIEWIMLQMRVQIEEIDNFLCKNRSGKVGYDTKKGILLYLPGHSEKPVFSSFSMMKHRFIL